MEESRLFSERHALPVTFAGWKQSEEIRQLMRSSLALVLPSRQESFGVALAEAVCCGTPVIGWADTVREISAALEMPVGETLESDADRPELLAEKILKVVENKSFDDDARERMAAKARDLFSVERYVAQNRALYRRLV